MTSRDDALVDLFIPVLNDRLGAAFSLAGLGVSNFRDEEEEAEEQPALFGGAAADTMRAR
ncbi:MAG TPA: hypothetical protein VEO74_13645 [Thermoanaerobaculia bacterium]|nr:hypothetical protein [Thermoanaerobaculia bacterium]